MKYTLAVFDLDGTILDTLGDLAASLNFALAENGLPARTKDEVRMFVGNGIRLLIERGVPSGTPVSVTDRVHSDFTAHYSRHCADTTKPYDGIKELIYALRAAGCKTAVVSNKADYAVQSLCRDYFPSMLDAAVGERANVRKKPEPDSVNEVLRELSVNRADAVYIGDSDVDIRTAANAGMDGIFVGWGFRGEKFLKEHGAAVIVKKPSEISDIIIGR